MSIHAATLASPQAESEADPVVPMTMVVVDDSADAATLADVLGPAGVSTFNVLASAEGEALALLVDVRDVLAVLPGDASPELVERARAAADHARPLAETVRITTCEAWPTGQPLALPGALDTASSIRAWLSLLPELVEPERSSNPEVNSNDAHVVAPNPPEPAPPSFSGPPRPLTAKLRPVPTFDSELLPEPLRIWALDIADRKQCSLEFVAVAVVVVLATVVGCKVAIRPKRFDSWVVVANLWAMVVARPGTLKSPAIEDVIGLLRKLAAEAREQYETLMAEHQRRLMIAEAKQKAAKDALQKAARKGTSEETLMSLAGDAAAVADCPAPIMKRYYTNDTTIEKLGELCRDNPGGILYFRDELMGLFRSLEKQGHESDRPFLLEGWNGTGSFTIDRIARGTIFIERLCLLILGGIQPGPLASYIRTANSEAGDDGFISRFQLAVYPDQDREFRIVDRHPNIKAKEDVEAVIKALITWEPADFGATADERGGIPFLRFDDAAQAYFYRWLEELETTKLRANESPAIESHLSKYRSLMPSLAHLFHLVDVVYSGEPGPVSLGAAERAAKWCVILEEHARRIYQSASEGDVEPARALAERITDSLPDPFTARDVIRKGWRDLTTAEEVELALGILEEHGWLASAEAPPSNRGGRPTIRYHLNPAVHAEGVSSVLSVPPGRNAHARARSRTLRR